MSPISVSAPRVKATDTWSYLTCPVCGEEGIEEGDDSIVVGSDRDDYDSPAGTRGGYVAISLYCCAGHEFSLVIGNHKGSQILACCVLPDEIEAMASLCESPMETAFWMQYCELRPSELDGLTPQVKVGAYRVDFGIEDRKLAIEIDGFDFHSSREHLAQDRKRQRAIETLGWRVCRFSGREVHRDPIQCLNDAVAWVSCPSPN